LLRREAIVVPRTLTTGMLMLGKMSLGVLIMESAPIIMMTIAITMKV